jgi:hypothetical protein
MRYIARDTKAPEIHVLPGRQYEPQTPGEDRWLSSPATGVQLRKEPRKKLGIRLARDPETAERLPEV